MRRPGVVVLAAVGLVACLVLLWRADRSRRPAAPVVGVASIVFLDVGQGDAALITSPEGKRALVDAGPSSRRIVGQLRALGVSTLDLVVVSHHHVDHYGGMAEVVREFHPKVFLDADSPHVTPSYLALLRRVKDERITAIRAKSESRRIELGSVVLTVLPQPPPNRSDENDNSIGIRVDFGDFSALLTGDSETSERAWWERNAPGLCSDVDILKLAHHGSRNGTDATWLERTHPRLAVASLGAGNEFGHPHPETLALLRSAGVPLVRTDESGPIAIQTDGRTWSLAEGAGSPTPAIGRD